MYLKLVSIGIGSKELVLKFLFNKAFFMLLVDFNVPWWRMSFTFVFSPNRHCEDGFTNKFDFSSSCYEATN